jgi:hypothetical protein
MTDTPATKPTHQWPTIAAGKATRAEVAAAIRDIAAHCDRTSEEGGTVQFDAMTAEFLAEVLEAAAQALELCRIELVANKSPEKSPEPAQDAG